MADRSGRSHEALNDGRLTARRVLRAQRSREPAKRARWGWLGAMIAMVLAAAALLLRPTHAPVEAQLQPEERAAPAAARTQSSAPAPD